LQYFCLNSGPSPNLARFLFFFYFSIDLDLGPFTRPQSFFAIFQIRTHIFDLRSASNHDPPTSAFHVAGITAVYHCAHPYILFLIVYIYGVQCDSLVHVYIIEY
jgi:hypothetical protein